MASLYDVARLAGVSTSTVSRVINNEYGVKASTKIKVRQAVIDCGYLPNQVAKDLKSQKTNLIGVIVPRVASHATAQGVDGLTNVLEQAGKQLLLACTQQQHQKELEYIQLFNQKRVEGIVLYATHLDDALIHAIHHSAVPIVLVGQDGSAFNIPSVIHDDFHVGVEAANRLIAKGGSEFGFIGVQSDDIAVGKLRLNGFTQSLTEQNKKLLFHGHGDFTIDSGYQLTKQYLTDYPRLNALFCATDRIAIGALRAIAEAGRIAGKEILVLGVGDDEFSSVCTPTLSTFNYAFDKAGEKSAELLLNQIANKTTKAHKTILSFKTVFRQSC